MSDAPTPRDPRDDKHGFAAYDNLRNHIDVLSRDLTAAREEATRWANTSQERTQHLYETQDKLKEVTEQRDRLAAALKICESESEKMLIEAKGYVNLLAYGIKNTSTEALQSLNPKLDK